MRPWLVLTHSGARFTTVTVELDEMKRQGDGADGTANLAAFAAGSLPARRRLGSVTGLFPVLRVDGAPIHESLAICEYVADMFPDARLWPSDALARARARALSCEMLSGFTGLRGELSSHLFGRVPGFRPGPGAERDIARVFEIWTECLDRSGGPFLFGAFGIADAMYYPVLGRFRTYGVTCPDELTPYFTALDALPAVRALTVAAAAGPRVPIYDSYLRGLGGEPDAALP